MFNKSIIIITLGILKIAIVVFSLNCNKSENSTNLNQVIKYVEQHSVTFGMTKEKNRLLLLLNFYDFNCPPCFDDFITLCDSLNTFLDFNKKKQLAILFRLDSTATSLNSQRLLIWAKANNIDFPILTANDSIFSKIDFVKSMAVVIDAEEKILFSEHFPMGIKKHNTITQLLTQNE
ncbi:MAG: hypothetical protein KJ666_16990 [Bacteroidetes bacterium]|nr:hypothetical protein [Bacteroidota bacterium]MBU2584614.1 hypothetical protein [Bacteroidota bacterium]